MLTYTINLNDEDFIQDGSGGQTPVLYVTVDGSSPRGVTFVMTKNLQGISH